MRYYALEELYRRYQKMIRFSFYWANVICDFLFYLRTRDYYFQLAISAIFLNYHRHRTNMSEFKLESQFSRQRQPQAISKLIEGLKKKNRAQTLLGVTGSGKTFTMANVIEKSGRPTLIITHNKTLAAQLYNELKEFFPTNHVEYFVSYYDYYQPEAYLPVQIPTSQKTQQ